jgi:hypothetical protein
MNTCPLHGGMPSSMMTLDQLLSVIPVARCLNAGFLKERKITGGFRGKKMKLNKIILVKTPTFFTIFDTIWP